MIIAAWRSTVSIPGPMPNTATEVDVNWRYVDSSNVNMVGWDNAKNMYVRYNSSEATYVYLGVSRQRVVAAALRPSVGGYINRKIKPNFDCVKIGVS